VRLFEVATVFKPNPESQTPRPQEELHLAIVLTGARHPAHWTGASGQDAKLPDMDIWDLKRHFELAVGLAAPAGDVQPAATGSGWEARHESTLVGSAMPLDADAPKWAGPLFGLEVSIAPLPRALARYQPLPTQPPVLRDISLVVPGGATAAAVEALLNRVGGAVLEQLDVLDEYRGPGLPEGTAGVDMCRTLTAT